DVKKGEAVVGEDKELEKLKAKAQAQIDSAIFTKEQLSEIETNAMANELMAKGEHNLAIHLLETQQTAREKSEQDKRVKIAKAAQTKKAQDFKSTLGFISSAASSSNKTLSAIGKSAGIANATMDTYAAANKALASAPPPWNFALAAAVTAAGFANVAKISGVKLAKGGMVMPSMGGTLATIGEAGKSEAVIPLDDDTTKEKLQDTIGGGDTYNFNVGTLVGNDGMEEFMNIVDEKLFELGRNRRSVQ
ncbi:MAG: hypothetical protein KAJ48_09170, partial [Elusimicrobiales bacterium]|nr:hypothetical protein [Elusimicrobiales bacterium]